MKFLILKKKKIFTPKICTVLHFFWWHYLIKEGKKLFSKITLKFYVLGLGNQCVNPENR